MIPMSSPPLGLRMTNNGDVGLPSEFSVASDHGDRIKAMLTQSEKAYACADYIGRRSEIDNTPIQEVAVDHNKVDSVCREKMCEWSYRVSDHFQTGREIVAVSFSYLDRFVDKCSCNRSAFKLAAMTTLYMANKIYGGPHTLTIGALAELSRGEFEISHISEMEVVILQTLAWRLHPPIAQCFIDAFHKYVGIPADESMSIAVYRRAMFFAELSLYDYTFVQRERSLIAIASLMNAMEGTNNITLDEQDKFFEAINLKFDLKYTLEMVETVRNRLWYIYSMSAQYKEDDAIAGSAAPTCIREETPRKIMLSGHRSSSSRSISPVSVATNTGPYHH